MESGDLILNVDKMFMYKHYIFLSFLLKCLQILAALCVCLTALRHGANIAITSGMIYSFEKNSDDYLNMTLEEASWLRKQHAYNLVAN